MNDVEIAVTKARKIFAELLNRVVYGGEEVVLTRHGKTVAGLVSAEDLELLRRARSARLDLTGAELPTVEEGARGQEPPLPIAAQYRPPGQQRPGFGR
ncbi:type II toxin-antitoxin system Phd/YefM family antitoxin [Actinomadura sp. 7K507]|uniref:type II toxin-antitoxin system Phd/YefM family antitoxin n=1 Tax=Actinomadura sp. 7K507 TaxID=2530365 RepID=UPI0010486753|nr:type II toxin-antitoxin system Phd/YefM family antitoxin [Actinomadura sp. 7K507]TDC79004.1 type II toxin-antitoxin system Phd/YefM family antitoxin [Actinomadura sp. 7K507]